MDSNFTIDFNHSLGEGNSVVYLCKTDDGREAAGKFLPLPDPESEASAKQEVDNQKRSEGPCVLKIIESSVYSTSDTGTAVTNMLIVMPLCDEALDETLATMEDSPPSDRIALFYAVACCMLVALSRVHDVGLLHKGV